MTAKKIKIPWMLIAIALAFAFNPNVAIIDPLPDFIGYMILTFALGKLAVLNSTLEEAKHAFEKMILVDGGKLLAIVWIFGMEALSERNTSMLVWCFAFGILEAIYLIPAYLKLFKGLSELGDFNPNVSIHAKPQRSRLSYTEKMRNLSVGFIILKISMNILPELSVLSNSSGDEFSYSNSLYRYIGVMRGLCFIPVMIVGIVWIVKLLKYFRRLNNDLELNISLCSSYETKRETRSGIFIKSNIKTACWFLLAGAVATLDIRMEKINMLPDAFVLALFIPALIYFARTVKLKWGELRAYMIAYGIIAIISYGLEAYYIESFTYNAMNKNLTAFVFYMASVVAVALQGVVFILLLLAVFKQIKNVIVEHTGYVKGKELQSEGEAQRIAQVQKELNKNFIVALDIAMVYVVSDVLYALYGAFYAFLNVNLGFLNVINLACGCLFIGMTAKALKETAEAVEIKYMLE